MYPLITFFFPLFSVRMYVSLNSIFFGFIFRNLINHIVALCYIFLFAFFLQHLIHHIHPSCCE